jgi:hypothetical protein
VQSTDCDAARNFWVVDERSEEGQHDLSSVGVSGNDQVDVLVIVHIVDDVGPVCQQDRERV